MRVHDTSGGGELADRLFASPQRWGWEYVEPASTTASPLATHEPVWQEPPRTPVRDIGRWVAFRQSARAKLRTRLFTILIVAGLLGIATNLRHGNGALVGLLVAIVGCGAVFATVEVPRRMIRRGQRDTSGQRDAMFTQYQQAHDEWEWQLQAHDYAELQRRKSALLWYPVLPRSGPSRVNVFGGTADGWASLIMTLGSAVISSGGPMLVLDFSEQNVAGGLAECALRKRYPVIEVDLPDNARPTELLAGLDADQLAELLAEVIETMRQGGDAVSLRALDAELIGIVAKRLREPPTFARLTAGLQVLHHGDDVSATLRPDEVDELAAHVGLVGHTEREKDELRFLISLLGLLAREDATGPDRTVVDAEAAGAATRGLPAAGLTVITVKAGQPRGQDILNRLLFHRVRHGLRNHVSRGVQSTVVVAGADRLGPYSLETMAEQARRVGVRLIVLTEHLRDDLGGSDSTVILMNLGNAREADKAAHFIGRGHKLMVSRLTRQVGDMFTTGTSTTRARLHTWQSTPICETAPGGEPVDIRNLPSTAYVLVERGRSGRRVVVGDCNPGIVLLDRVAAHPRGD